jgi:hypothetical protein
VASEYPSCILIGKYLLIVLCNQAFVFPVEVEVPGKEKEVSSCVGILRAVRSRAFCRKSCFAKLCQPIECVGSYDIPSSHSGQCMQVGINILLHSYAIIILVQCCYSFAEICERRLLRSTTPMNDRTAYPSSISNYGRKQ